MNLLTIYLAAAAYIVAVTAQASCRDKFKAITAVEFTSSMNPAWNTGNTLDAMPTETSWGQPLLVNSTFKNVKALGFKGVRLPG